MLNLRKKPTKKRKKVSEIKVNIDNHEIVQGKKITRVFQFESVFEIREVLNNIEPNTRAKILINYKLNKFYVFKTESSKKLDLEESELDTSEIATLIKSFYSEEEMQWDKQFERKPKKIKSEIAPALFQINDNYLVSENRYINVMYLEHLKHSLNLKDIIKSCWLSIDCYKVDNDTILNKLMEMKKDKVIDKKFSDFISDRIENIIYKLKQEIIFQAEFNLLLYNTSLEELNKYSLFIKETLRKNGCISYTPNEKINTRKLFEKCIYPCKVMDVVHSIADKELFKMIGCEN